MQTTSTLVRIRSGVRTSPEAFTDLASVAQLEARIFSINIFLGLINTQQSHKERIFVVSGPRTVTSGAGITVSLVSRPFAHLIDVKNINFM